MLGSSDIIDGALPFVAGMVAPIGLLMALPGVALWLANAVMGGG